MFSGAGFAARCRGVCVKRLLNAKNPRRLAQVPLQERLIEVFDQIVCVFESDR
jgi:hypothetical protein